MLLLFWCLGQQDVSSYLLFFGACKSLSKSKRETAHKGEGRGEMVAELVVD
jgi:hypothetical protein